MRHFRIPLTSFLHHMKVTHLMPSLSAQQFSAWPHAPIMNLWGRVYASTILAMVFTIMNDDQTSLSEDLIFCHGRNQAGHRTPEAKCDKHWPCQSTTVHKCRGMPPVHSEKHTAAIRKCLQLRTLVCAFTSGERHHSPVAYSLEQPEHLRFKSGEDSP
ncbi:hypothetical protein CEXT_790281 [Caerostris extrusa]|uniref:Uncharacterized protein n=1 Tax=Caerostris extrusa TaxID=172846 RepID=A0AAV4VA01_CAEEX|nr:hypothetical protein CEXT_790281 [Caerostris extrusa]